MVLRAKLTSTRGPVRPKMLGPTCAVGIQASTSFELRAAVLPIFKQRRYGNFGNHRAACCTGCSETPAARKGLPPGILTEIAEKTQKSVHSLRRAFVAMPLVGHGFY